jgi:hypothetical protein
MGLIGISGKIGSGKDTVGRIIQGLLVGEEKFVDGIIGFLEAYDDIDENVTPLPYTIKKFAGKLKECVSIITGYTADQLEDPEIKGRVAFMRRQKIDHVTGISLDDSVELYESISVRELLQELGTQVGRSISENLWADALMKEYVAYQYRFNPGYYQCKCSVCGERFMADKRQPVCEPCCDKVFFPNWIITDMRFPNELKAVKDREGITIRVNRPCKTCGTYEGKYCSNPYHLHDKHASETALDNAEFDYTIENNGTVEDLVEKVREILIKEKLL